MKTDDAEKEFWTNITLYTLDKLSLEGFWIKISSF